MLCLANSSATAELELADGVSISFLSGKAAGEFLAKPDDFTKSLSQFDRSARLRVGRVVDERQFLAHIAKHGLDWTDPEKKRLTATVKETRALLQDLQLPLPKDILLIKTTGKEDADAAYTRRNGIIFSAKQLRRDGDGMRKLFLHELFHIMSRKDPKLATRLYRIIGYKPSPSLNFPEELAARKLTNPDAPFNRHAIEFEHDGKSVTTMPILFSRVQKYDDKQGGTLFRYLVFRLLILDPNNPAEPARDGMGELIMLRPDKAKQFHKKIGRNTGYIIHPEEIMADNFVYMVLDRKDLPNPEIVERLRASLTAERN